MMVKDKKEDFKEEDFIPNESMICTCCDKSNFEHGKPHNAGKQTQERDAPDRWLRLFMCNNCKIESAL